jgi:hypothetical protein
VPSALFPADDHSSNQLAALEDRALDAIENTLVKLMFQRGCIPFQRVIPCLSKSIIPITGGIYRCASDANGDSGRHDIAAISKAFKERSLPFGGEVDVGSVGAVGHEQEYTHLTLPRASGITVSPVDVPAILQTIQVSEYIDLFGLVLVFLVVCPI